MLGRLFLALIVMIIGSAAQASPRTLTVGHPLCYAVTAQTVDDTALPAFSCSGQPVGYQDRSLWLRADLRKVPLDPEGMALLIHQTRFDRLVVRFGYADGAARYQLVRKGDFGEHWRAGGQINFYVPQRDSRLTSLTLKFDHLTSVALLRALFVGVGEAARDVTILGCIVGGTLTLLALSAIYNLLLAIAVRRQFIAWHGAWAGLCMIWAIIWSQLILSILPGMAGTISSQICTMLATVAIGCATMCAAACLGRDHAPRWVRIGLPILGIVIVLIGIPGSIVTGPALDSIGDYLGYAILADLFGVMAAVIWAWRRGSVDARDFAMAWTLPMLALGLSQVVNMGTSLFGGGAQIAVLFASALQTVWLSIAISLRLARMRNERDAARTEQAVLGELARRDPLTGLLNRRGFTAIVSGWMEQRRSSDMGLGLLIIDVDHFKEINDRLGHDAGDRVLQNMAKRLTAWESDLCSTGRLGGEEFIVAIRNLDESAFRAFADEVRAGLATVDAGSDAAANATVSIGAAQLEGRATFEDLYRAADEALYTAKHAGRDRVAIARCGSCVVLDAGGQEPAGMDKPNLIGSAIRPRQHAASQTRSGE